MEKKPVKRGRKPKGHKASTSTNIKVNTSETKVLKKRGRKPKGGKIIHNILQLETDEKKGPIYFLMNIIDKKN